MEATLRRKISLPDPAAFTGGGHFAPCCAGTTRTAPAMPRGTKARPLTGRQDPVNELLPGDFPVLVFVDSPEEVHDPRLLVVHPAHVLLPPHVKVKIGKLLQLEVRRGEERRGEGGFLKKGH